MEYFLIILIFIVGVSPLFIEIFNNKFELFNIKNSFIVYYLIQLGFSGFISLKTENVSIISLSPIVYKEYYIKALFAALLGISFFQIGYYLTNIKFRSTLFIHYELWSTINKNIVILFYFLLGLLCFFIFLKTNGGLGEFLLQIEGFRAGGISGQGFLIVTFTQLLTIACSINLVYALRSSGNSRSSLKKAFVLIILASMPSLILGFRSLIILPFLTYLTIYNFGFKKISIKKILPIGIIIIFIFTLYGIYREIPKDVSFSVDQAYSVLESNPELLFSLVSRSKGIEVVASVIKTMEETKLYAYGYMIFVEALAILVPRRLWEDKPIPGSIRFTTYFFGSDLASTRGYVQDSWGGISPTIIGDAFWNFGWLGVCVMPLILGIIYKIFFTYFINNYKSPKVLLTYSLLYPSFSMISESLQGYLNGIVIIIFLVYITFFFLKLKLK